MGSKSRKDGERASGFASASEQGVRGRPEVSPAIKVRSLPAGPGVYLMKDRAGTILYIGKAKELKKRVATYWAKDDPSRYQIRFLMARVADIDVVVTETDKEALLLENSLIKRHRPRYNIQLKDDKSYASIKLSVKDRFPRVYVTRRIVKDGSRYFGPYASAAACHETVDFIERHFRLRTCADHEFANRSRPCLQYQIKRCDAPCVGRVGHEEYGRMVRQVELLLEGRNQELIDELGREMARLAAAEEFEKAAQARDVIRSLEETLEKQRVARHAWIDQDLFGLYREGERVTLCVMNESRGKIRETRFHHLKGLEESGDLLESFLIHYYERHPLPDEILLPLVLPSEALLSQILTERRGRKVSLRVPKRGHRLDLLKLAERNARGGFGRRDRKETEIGEILARLQSALDLQNLPKRIECFDISNLAGQQAVGSLACLKDGEPFKDGYRRFKIRTVRGIDDFAMMHEVLRRRLSRLQSADEKWVRPDLIVVDGGKGQLKAVEKVLEELNVTGIDLVALAKKKEGENQDKVFLPGRKNPVLLGRHSSLLHLLMRIRDEAHRFAIGYHKRLRARQFLPQ